MLCRFPLRRDTIPSQRNLMNSLVQDWRKRLLHLWEIDWNSWRVQKTCAFIVQKFRLFQSVRKKKLWGNGSGVCTKTWSIVCSRRQVNQWMTPENRCCVSKPVNKHWSETQLCTKRADLHHVTGRVGGNNVRVLELNVWRKLALMKQVVPYVNTTQSTLSASSSNINKRFWVANLFTWIVKD